MPVQYQYIIVARDGDVQEGPWEDIEDAEEFLETEVGHAAVMLAIPAGKRHYSDFRDLVHEAQLFVDELSPDATKGYLYWPEERAAVTETGEYLAWGDDAQEKS